MIEAANRRAWKKPRRATAALFNNHQLSGDRLDGTYPARMRAISSFNCSFLRFNSAT